MDWKGNLQKSVIWGNLLQCGNTDFCVQRQCEYIEVHWVCGVVRGAVFPLAHVDWKS